MDRVCLLHLYNPPIPSLNSSCLEYSSERLLVQGTPWAYRRSTSGSPLLQQNLGRCYMELATGLGISESNRIMVENVDIPWCLNTEEITVGHLWACVGKQELLFFLIYTINLQALQKPSNIT